MLHLLRSGRVYLWSSAVPIVAGVVYDGVLHWQGTQQLCASAAPIGWHQPQVSSSALLPEAAAFGDAADSQLLMGRGDPRTRRGKIFKGSYGKARPKKKIDWRAWSEAQLDLPPADIAIPHPPPSRRTPLIPSLEDAPAQLSDDVEPRNRLEDGGLDLDEQQGQQQAEQQRDTVRPTEQHT